MSTPWFYNAKLSKKHKKKERLLSFLPFSRFFLINIMIIRINCLSLDDYRELTDGGRQTNKELLANKTHDQLWQREVY